MDLSESAAAGLRAGLEETVRTQRGLIEDELRPLLDGHRAVALLNFPNHHNVGDPALWLGTLELLDELGIRVTHHRDWQTYERDALARALDKGTTAVLLCGGGNLGDVYPAQQAREAVLRDFPGVPTIQLSQSIWFKDPENARAFGQLAARHSDFTLLVRDRASVTAAHDLGLEARLVPDMAMGLGPLRRPVEPTVDVLWLRRTDRESTSRVRSRKLVKAGDAVDWLAVPKDQVVRDPLGRTLQSLNMRIGWVPREELGPAGRAVRRQLWRTYRPLARRRLDFGLRLLSRGRVVVSDRLHAHILATLLGIPNIAVDNANGKVRAYVDTWQTDATAGVLSATTHDEAASLLAEFDAVH